MSRQSLALRDGDGAIILQLDQCNRIDECPMIRFSAQELAGKSCCFRYLHYIVTNLRLISPGEWRRAGEPNPFVRKTYRHKMSEIADFDDIFEDFHANRRWSAGRGVGARRVTSEQL